MDITSTPVWQELIKHQQQIAKIKIADEFAKDPYRYNNFSVEACGLLLDYSKNRITTQTLALLGKLAENANLATKIEDMFTGKPINITQNRAVLHTALRNPNHESIYLNNENILPKIHEALARVEKIATAIRSGEWVGYSKKPITDVVNIGIGGSDLGPNMVTKALSPYTDQKLKMHFVSNIDGTAISEVINQANPETTLFIVSSKTFSTTETLKNAETAKKWIYQSAQNAAKVSTADIINLHFIAVTSNQKLAEEFGIVKSNILPFWDWVGGRFSLWSAIGISIAIAVGMKNFRELLGGAYALDQHFRHTPLLKNMPVILALISIWNINFWHTKSQAIVPYEQYLELLPTFLQQIIMESNGKQVSIDGNYLNYSTSPVIFGSVGTNGQHAFHQAIMQGTQLIPVDFIVARQSHNPIDEHHLILYANCLAQAQALMQGYSENELKQKLTQSGLSEDTANKLTPHQMIPGNVPSNTILMDKLTPHNLGALIALYEHMIFVQGIIWQINSYDQWGVELGKHLAKNIIPHLEKQIGIKSSSNEISKIDSSTENLVKSYGVKPISRVV